MEPVTLYNLSPGAFEVSIKSPTDIHSGRTVATTPGQGVATLPGNSRGVFNAPPPPADPIPGPVTREDLGQKIDLIA